MQADRYKIFYEVLLERGSTEYFEFECFSIKIIHYSESISLI